MDPEREGVAATVAVGGLWCGTEARGNSVSSEWKEERKMERERNDGCMAVHDIALLPTHTGPKIITFHGLCEIG